LKVEADPPLLIRASAAANEALKNPAKGRRLAEGVAADARDANQPEALVVALRAAGRAARELYDHEAAEKLVAEAAGVARRNGLNGRLSEVLITRSSIRLEEGRIDLARRDIAKARDCASVETLPDVAFAEALLEEHAGRLPAAEAAYELVIESSGRTRIDLAPKTHNNLAQVKRRLGDLDGARRHLEVSIELASSFSPMVVAIATHNLAGVAGESGDPVQALRLYDDALKMLQKAELPLGEHFLDKTHTFLGLRLLDEAAGAVSLAVTELDVPGGSLMFGEALILQARVAFEREDFQASITAADAAAEMYARQDRQGWQAVASLLALRSRASENDVGEGFLAELAAVEASLSEYGDHVGLVDALMLKGRTSLRLGLSRNASTAFSQVAGLTSSGPVLLRIQGHLAQSLESQIKRDRRRLGRASRAGLDALERYRQSFVSSELRAKAAKYGVELSELGLRSALEHGTPLQVWSWLERTKASVIGGAIAARTPADLGPLLAELRESRRAIDDPSIGHSGRRTQQDRLARLEGRIRAATWKREKQDGVDAFARPTQSRLAHLKTALGSRVLVQYGVVDGKLISVVVSSNSVRMMRMGPIGVVEEAGRNLGFALNRLSQPRSDASASAARLSADDALEVLDSALVRPIARLMGSPSHAVVVPPSDMIGLPWGSLSTFREVAVCIVPSAMLWAATATSSTRSERVVAIEGPGLDAAAAEVRLVAKIHGDAEALVGRAATVSATLEAVDGAKLVHLACHGTLRSDSPTFSGFRMSDGPLTVHDLEGLSSPAHHWVLAACDLGNPGALSGSDLEGVLASLLGGGAAAVVAAITAVPDQVSAALMAPLHQALAMGASLPDALHQAKKTLDQNDPMSFVTGVAFNCYGGG